jgi:Mg2+-importing ATPase
VLVIRTRKSFLRSWPAKPLLTATLLTVAVTVVLPFTPLGGIFGFDPVPLSFLLLIAAVVAAYIISAEMVKAVFYKRVRL